MARTSTAEAGEDGLQQRVQRLQRDWDAYKKQTTGRLRSSMARTRASPPPDVLARFFDNSPKKLLSSLALRASPPQYDWEARGGNREAREIALERRAAVRSGRLRGRRLLEALEDAALDEVKEEEEEAHGRCLLTTLPGCGGGKPTCACGRSATSPEEWSCCSCSSTTSGSLSGEEEEEEEEEVGGGGVSWVRVVILLVVLAFVLMAAFDFDEYSALDATPPT